jgi:hypothetical protein
MAGIGNTSVRLQGYSSLPSDVLRTAAAATAATAQVATNAP